MSERVGIQIPVWCSAICRNAFNEKCVEECSINRDCSYFEEKPSLKLSDMPRFPLKESANMTKEERFAAVTIYLSKVVDHLQGVVYEPNPIPIRRSSTDGPRSSTLPENIQIQSVLHGISEAAASLPDTEKREDQNVRPEEVVRDSD